MNVNKVSYSLEWSSCTDMTESDFLNFYSYVPKLFHMSLWIHCVYPLHLFHVVSFTSPFSLDYFPDTFRQPLQSEN
jgi:hypothetical protein